MIWMAWKLALLISLPCKTYWHTSSMGYFTVRTLHSSILLLCLHIHLPLTSGQRHPITPVRCMRFAVKISAKTTQLNGFICYIVGLA